MLGSPGPQVAVPKLVAKKLTYPQRVFEHNLDKLKAAVRNGPDVWPGAHYVYVQVRCQYHSHSEGTLLSVADMFCQPPCHIFVSGQHKSILPESVQRRSLSLSILQYPRQRCCGSHFHTITAPAPRPFPSSKAGPPHLRGTRPARSG